MPYTIGARVTWRDLPGTVTQIDGETFVIVLDQLLVKNGYRFHRVGATADQISPLEG